MICQINYDDDHSKNSDSRCKILCSKVFILKLMYLTRFFSYRYPNVFAYLSPQHPTGKHIASNIRFYEADSRKGIPDEFRFFMGYHQLSCRVQTILVSNSELALTLYSKQIVRKQQSKETAYMTKSSFTLRYTQTRINTISLPRCFMSPWRISKSHLAIDKYFLSVFQGILTRVNITQRRLTNQDPDF